MGEVRSDLYSDIYKVILANYSELDDFILYNYPDVSRWGYSQQGVDFEVIPNRYKWHGISGSYALAIKQIREDLLRKSVYYRGSFNSFQTEFDPLLSLYKEILLDINSSHDRLGVLLKAVRKFLLSLDEEFHTNDYFFYKLNQFCSDYSGKPLPFDLKNDFEIYLKNYQQSIHKNFFLGIDAKDKENNRLENETIKIYRLEKSQSKQLIDTVMTNNLGVVGIKLQEGSYIAELEKYRLNTSIELNWHSTITFTKPSFLLSAKVVDPDNKQIGNIKIHISATDALNKKSRTIVSNKFGNSTITVPMGNYLVEIKKYNLSKTCDLSQNCSVMFTLPRKRHWWQKY